MTIRTLHCISAVWFTVLAAQAQQVQSLSRNGDLVFWESDLPNQVYRVEWAPSLSTGSMLWRSDWQDLSLILPTGRGSNTVPVPMFYRVVAVTNPPVNLVRDAATVHVNVIQGGAQGSDANTHDGLWENLYGAYQHHGSDGSVDCSVTSVHQWATEQMVESIRVACSARSFPHGNYEQRLVTFRVALLLTDSWTDIYSEEFSPSGHDDMPQDIRISTGWAKCKGVRIYVAARAYSYEGDRQQEVWASVSEVEAIGRLYRAAP